MLGGRVDGARSFGRRFPYQHGLYFDVDGGGGGGGGSCMAKVFLLKALPCWARAEMRVSMIGHWCDYLQKRLQDYRFRRGHALWSYSSPFWLRTADAVAKAPRHPCIAHVGSVLPVKLDPFDIQHRWQPSGQISQGPHGWLTTARNSQLGLAEPFHICLSTRRDHSIPLMLLLPPPQRLPCQREGRYAK